VRRRAVECGDEPLCFTAFQRTGRRRAAIVCGAPHWLRRHPTVDVLVSDDGCQHLRLARDAQVLVFDERGEATRLAPTGRPAAGVPARAVPPRSLVVYNSSTPSTPLRGTSRAIAGGAVALADWWLGQPASHDVTTRCAAARARRGGRGPADRFFTMLRERASHHGPAVPITTPTSRCHGPTTRPT